MLLIVFISGQPFTNLHVWVVIGDDQTGENTLVMVELTVVDQYSVMVIDRLYL